MDLSCVDMNEVVHALRSAQLRRTAKGAEVFLSAGCSGGWYFDWIEENYGPTAHHIGLEYYSPVPDVLPPNVTWIANTVGNMEAVGDASVDLVFSGQNIEHLWPGDVVGFMLEANRVLRPGGRLVMDSPNRIATAALNWSHPEHTVELTPDEAVELSTLAGFEVESVVGLWQSIDGGRVMPHVPADEKDMVARTLNGLGAPDECFVWWLEGHRAGEPDRTRLKQRVEEIFQGAWPERLNRLTPLTGDVGPDGLITSHWGSAGAVFFGPYAALPAGSYRVTFEITSVVDSSASPGWCDVRGGGQDLAVAHLPAMAAGQTVPVVIDIDLPELTFGVEFRLISNGTGQVRSPLHVDIQAR